MRAIYAFGLALITLAGVAMVPAIIGRSLDWSPYALVMSGAIAGLCVGIGMTMFLFDPEGE